MKKSLNLEDVVSRVQKGRAFMEFPLLLLQDYPSLCSLSERVQHFASAGWRILSPSRIVVHLDGTPIESDGALIFFGSKESDEHGRFAYELEDEIVHISVLAGSGTYDEDDLRLIEERARVICRILACAATASLERREHGELMSLDELHARRLKSDGLLN